MLCTLMQLNHQGIYHFQSSLFSERVHKVDSVIEYNLSFPLSPDIIAHLDESTAKYSTEHSGPPHY